MEDNSTETADFGQWVYTTTITVYTLFGIFGIVGNTMVLLVIALVDDLRGVTNLFIANQSLIDLSSSVFLVASFVVPLPSLPPGRAVLVEFLCRFWHTKYIFWSLIVASSLNLVLMTLERLCAVFYPIRYRGYTNLRCLKLIAAVPWFIGFGFQLILILFTRVEDNRCVFLFFDDSHPTFRTSFAAVAVFLEFFFPVFVMVVVYACIAVKLQIDSISLHRPAVRRPTGESVPISRNPAVIDYRSRATRNTIKTMLTVSIFFILCWSLNQVAIFLLTCCGSGIDFSGLLYQISVFMGFGNMWINPFIYSFQYRWFQKGLKKIFCKEANNRHLHTVPTVSEAGFAEKGDVPCV